jgi:ketosteroid isomerase-like protein
MSDLDELRAAVGRLTDRAELQDLVSRYATAVDDHDIEAVSRMYTADASFTRRDRTRTGRDEVLRSLEGSMRRYGPTIHTVHSLVVDWVDADHARGVVTGHAELAAQGQLVVAAYRYRDTYRRQADGWRFGSRELQFIYGVPVTGLASIFAEQLRLRWPDEPAAAADLPETLPTWNLDARDRDLPARQP